MCGYCHVRKENYNFKTAQNHPREDQPHPVVGQSYKAGQDDWRTWYPDKMLIPGVLPGQPVSKNYPNTDLNNAFFTDEKAQKWGSHDARKHHEEYQEYIQSSHYKNNLLSCSDCHSPHARQGQGGDRADEDVRRLPRHDVRPEQDHAGARVDRLEPVRALAHVQQEPGPAGRPDGDEQGGTGALLPR